MNPPKNKKKGAARLAGTGERERERERESFIRNNLHNGVVSGAARGQAEEEEEFIRIQWIL